MQCYAMQCNAGSFRDDQKHGQGVLHYSAQGAEDGDQGGGRARGQFQYSGRFMFDKKWGRGRVTGEGGLVFDGEFKCDVMHGHGR